MQQSSLLAFKVRMINSDTLFSTIYWLPQSNAPVHELREVIAVSWKITVIFLLSLELKDFFAWSLFKPSLNSLHSNQRTHMNSATSEDMLLKNQEECSQNFALLARAMNQMLLQNFYLNWQILKKAFHSSNTFIFFFLPIKKGCRRILFAQLQILLKVRYFLT